jgi:hypothetical protein
MLATNNLRARGVVRKTNIHEIKQAIERFGMSLETWHRQERAFGLLRKVYAKQAKIRGEQAPIAPGQHHPLTLLLILVVSDLARAPLKRARY